VPRRSYFEDGDRAAGVFGVLATGFAVLLGFVVFLAFERAPGLLPALLPATVPQDQSEFGLRLSSAPSSPVRNW